MVNVRSKNFVNLAKNRIAKIRQTAQHETIRGAIEEVFKISSAL